MSRATPDSVTRACEMRGTSLASTFAILSRVFPHAENVSSGYAFTHGLDARLNGGHVVSQRVQTRSEGHHLDLYPLAEFAVVARCIAYVVESEIRGSLTLTCIASRWSRDRAAVPVIFALP
jgi:hypothetical protein